MICFSYDITFYLLTIFGIRTLDRMAIPEKINDHISRGHAIRVKYYLRGGEKPR